MKKTVVAFVVVVVLLGLAGWQYFDRGSTITDQKYEIADLQRDIAARDFGLPAFLRGMIAAELAEAVYAQSLHLDATSIERKTEHVDTLVTIDRTPPGRVLVRIDACMEGFICADILQKPFSMEFHLE